MHSFLQKFSTRTKRQQSCIAGIVFVFGLVLLPNVLVYAAATYTGYKLITNTRYRWLFVTLFSVITFFSFVLLFAEDVPPAVQTTSVINKEVPLASDTNSTSETVQATTSTATKITESEPSTAKTSSLDVTEETIEPAPVVPNEPTNLYQVASVVDGDTLKLVMNGTSETIRLIGIDTPETVHPTKPVECMGIEASNKAKELLTGQTVRFVSDDTQGERDKYGRLLGYVFLPDGQNFGELMLRLGFAYEYTYADAYQYQTNFKAAEQLAQTNKVGLWADRACEDETITDIPTPAPQTAATAVSDGHTWYVSSYYTSKFYYCEDTSAWEGLSKKYLETYQSEAALQEKYPTHTLHESCL